MKVSTLKMHHEHHPMRPTRQIAISFLAVILIGSVLLMLPICNNTTPTAYLNNLFIATSATCVTGLVPVVTVQYIRTNRYYYFNSNWWVRFFGFFKFIINNGQKENISYK